VGNHQVEEMAIRGFERPGARCPGGGVQLGERLAEAFSRNGIRLFEPSAVSFAVRLVPAGQLDVDEVDGTCPQSAGITVGRNNRVA
jgi:hypothetical protein